MKPEVLRIEWLSCMDRGNYYLKHINLYILKGEIVGLFGLNGSGKTALIDALFSSQNLLSGKIYYHNTQISPMTHHQATKIGIYHISNFRSLNQNMSVAENLFLGIKNNAIFVNKTKERKQANEILTKYRLNFSANTPIYRLDSAQKYALLIIKAITRGASMIIIDNVLSSLPQEKSAVLNSVVRQAAAEGVAFMLCDYKIEVLHKIAGRIYYIHNGQICAEYDQNYWHAHNPVTEPMTTISPRAVTWNPQQVFEFRFLLDGRIEQISANKGEIINICFESELFKNIIDYCLKRNYLHFGQLWIDNKQVKPGAFHTFENAGLYYLPQNPPIFHNLTFFENIITTMQRTNRFAPFINSRNDRLFFSEVFYNYFFPATKISADSTCMDCSILTQKKIALLRLAAATPKVIVLNEPTYNLDHMSTVDYFKCITDLAASGITIVIISLNCEDVIPLCNKAYFVKNSCVFCFTHTNKEEIDKTITFYRSFWS